MVVIMCFLSWCLLPTISVVDLFGRELEQSDLGIHTNHDLVNTKIWAWKFCRLIAVMNTFDKRFL